MAADDDRRDRGRKQRYQPLGLLIAVLLVVLVVATFFVPFLVIPLAILVIFYVGFAVSDRARPMSDEPAGSQRAPTSRDDEPDAA